LDGAIASLLATNGTYTAGLMTEAEFNAAKTSLVAKNEYDAATIVAMVNNAGSLVEISADKINFESGNFSVDAQNIDFSAYNMSLDSTNGEMWLGGGQGNYRTVIAPTEISTGIEGANQSWTSCIRLTPVSGSIVVETQGGGYSEINSAGFAHHPSQAPGTDFEVTNGNLVCNTAKTQNLLATSSITVGND